jgi:hypothetical protein
MLNYYETKYIEHKIAAQINLIETIHKYYYGLKKDEAENDKIIKRIVDQIADNDDKIFIAQLIQQKNVFGIRRKICAIMEKVNLDNLSKNEIDNLMSIRGQIAHGNIEKDFDLETYIQLNEKLNEIIINIVKLEIDNFV